MTNGKVFRIRRQHVKQSMVKMYPVTSFAQILPISLEELMLLNTSRIMRYLCSLSLMLVFLFNNVSAQGLTRPDFRHAEISNYTSLQAQDNRQVSANL